MPPGTTSISIEAVITIIVALILAISVILFFLLQRVISQQDKATETLSAITLRQNDIENQVKHIDEECERLEKKIDGAVTKIGAVETKIGAVERMVHRKGNELQDALSRRELGDDPAGQH